MYLHEATAETSFVKSLPFKVFAFNRDELIDGSEMMLRDVITFLESDSRRAVVKIQNLRANLIILLCEVGRFSEARSEMELLGDGENVRDFKRAVQAVYFMKFSLVEISPQTAAQILETGWASVVSRHEYMRFISTGRMHHGVKRGFNSRLMFGCPGWF